MSEKHCEYCGVLLVRKIRPSGRLESTWYFRQRRRFCNRLCRDEKRRELGVTDAAGRKRAQRLYPAQPCRLCGDPHGQRHHKDENPLNNTVENIEFLCSPCHVKEHWRHGTYERHVARQRVMGYTRVRGEGGLFIRVAQP